MDPALVVHAASGLLVASFLGLFCLTALRERTPRAALVSALLLVAFCWAWIGAYLFLASRAHWLWLPNGALIGLTALFFLPTGRSRPIEKSGPCARVDERDTLFAREDYVPGTPEYEQYYAMRPENQKLDERIRKLPELLAPGGKLYDPVRSSFTRSIFEIIKRTIGDVDGEVADPPAELGPEQLEPAAMTRTIKELALQMGAAEVGIARLDPDWAYSHVGRGPEPWGSPIERLHGWAIVFTLEMGYAEVRQAPRVELTTESANQYLNGTLISLTLASLIRKLGFPARAQISGSNYQIMLPPVARDAGLGELGRFGYLISERTGARVRLGAVTTDLPLVPDEPVAFGVREFCELCKRCATCCPSASIPDGERVEHNGVWKWPMKTEPCMLYWRTVGSDCGLCMKVCPYAHPRSLVHRLIRAGVGRSAFARRISVWGEDLFYGRRVQAPDLAEPGERA
jgi:hypothetical protein